ncbi:GntR family transcriptional regulator [Nocardioidaceae bacterium SCSIO 66511]|nr:GntR family transcriptional regulator [Nocardioidaceae bacterium SCSIO 66511]
MSDEAPTKPTTGAARASLAAERLPRSESLRDGALRILRNAVVSGEVRDGELYSVAELARQLGISASPVREAMLTLVNDGIMEPVRNRGFRITPIDDDDLAEIVALRRMLEVPAVAGLAERDLSADLPNLRELATQIERTAARGDVQAFLAADREFHLALLSLTGNRRLVDTVAKLRDQTRLYGLRALADEGQLDPSAAEHHAILEALSEHDAARVEGLMDRHLAHIQDEWANGPT